MKGISKEEGKIPIIICMPLSVGLQFADNLIERCKFCDCEVQLRPHMPWPRHTACIACFAERFNAKQDQLAVTPQTVRELVEFQRADEKKH